MDIKLQTYVLNLICENLMRRNGKEEGKGERGAYASQKSAVNEPSVYSPVAATSLSNSDFIKGFIGLHIGPKLSQGTSPLPFFTVELSIMSL